jgi:hypothetical protein
MDQYHGQGGTFLIDPETGERVLLERTEEPTPEAASEILPEPPTEPAPSIEPPRRRARTEAGKFRGDDPATPDVNEAWQ